MPTIAFVTICKGRLHHIKQTLPRLLAEQPDEVVVVDYGCPDRVADWVEANAPAAKAVRVTDDPGFCAARARNLGAAATRTDWVVFIDADVLVNPGWLSWLHDNLRPGCFYLSDPDGREPETYGTAICARADFAALAGYDEVFRGWGGEDEDLYQRLRRAGTRQEAYPNAFVEAIKHGDEERAGWSGMQTRAQAQMVNQCYIAAKAIAQSLHGNKRPLPLPVRKQLMSATSRKLQAWFAAGASQPTQLRYLISHGSGDMLSPPYHARSELTFAIRIENRQATTADLAIAR